MTFKAILAGAILALSTSSTFASDLSDGPGSSGGGNSVNNIFIENYGVSIEDLAGYKTYFQPLMLDLKKYMPYLADLLTKQAQRTNWYLIPRDIQQLSEKITGLPVQSDQVASQGVEEVFISQQKFDSLVDDKNRGVLILHEAVLGLYIHHHGLLTKENAKTIMSHVRDTTRAISSQLYSRNSFEMVLKLTENGFTNYATRHVNDQKPILTLNQKYLVEMKKICDRELSPPTRDSQKEKFWLEQYNLMAKTIRNLRTEAEKLDYVTDNTSLEHYPNPWTSDLVGELGTSNSSDWDARIEGETWNVSAKIMYNTTCSEIKNLTQK